MTEALVPYQAQTLADTMRLGDILARSGYFADSREAAQAVVKVLAGQELGFGPIASMTGVNIIKGNVTLSANLIAAAIKRSGRYNYRVRKMTDAECSIEFFEGGESLGISTFTAEDAKTAGLSGDNWRKFPRNMLFARAISNGAKWFCPDLGGGPLYTPDELGATVDSETGEIVDVPVVVTEPPATGTAAPADMPFRPSVEGAIEWACKAAPQVWPTDNRGVIVTDAVQKSFRKLQSDGLTGRELMDAWVKKVNEKAATWERTHADEHADGDEPLFN